MASEVEVRKIEVDGAEIAVIDYNGHEVEVGSAAYKRLVKQKEIQAVSGQAVAAAEVSDDSAGTDNGGSDEPTTGPQLKKALKELKVTFNSKAPVAELKELYAKAKAEADAQGTDDGGSGDDAELSA